MAVPRRPIVNDASVALRTYVCDRLATCRLVELDEHRVFSRRTARRRGRRLCDVQIARKGVASAQGAFKQRHHQFDPVIGQSVVNRSGLATDNIVLTSTEARAGQRVRLVCVLVIFTALAAILLLARTFTMASSETGSVDPLASPDFATR